MEDWGISLKSPRPRQEFYKEYQSNSKSLREQVISAQDNPPSSYGAEYINQNRYADIIPMDKYVVKLITSTTHKHTKSKKYINASHVSVQNRHFILTQAPLVTTIGDFWQMVFEQRTSLIIMLTRLAEGEVVKAETYWPRQSESLVLELPYGILTVSELQPLQRMGPNIQIRKFKLSIAEKEQELCQNKLSPILEELTLSDSPPGIKESEEDQKAGSKLFAPRIVYHVHASFWPDYGAPSNADEILSLIKLVATLEQETNMCNDGDLEYQEKQQRLLAKCKEKQQLVNRNIFMTPLPGTTDKTRTSPEITSHDRLPDDPSKLLPKIPLSLSLTNGFHLPILAHCSAGVGRSASFIIAYTFVNDLERRMAGSKTFFDEMLKQSGLVTSFVRPPQIKVPASLTAGPSEVFAPYTPLVSLFYPVAETIRSLRTMRSVFVCEPLSQFEFIHFVIDVAWVRRRWP